MRKYTFVPNKQLGDIRFGADRSDIRSLLGEYKEFKKTKFSKNTTDDFGFCHVYYDTDDKCEAVEVFEDVVIEYNGNTIFPNTVNGTVAMFDDMEIDEYGATSVKYSVGLCSDDDDNIECILLGKEGYYK